MIKVYIKITRPHLSWIKWSNVQLPKDSSY